MEEDNSNHHYETHALGWKEPTDHSPPSSGVLLNTLLLSFKFSQGDKRLQSRLLEYVKSVNPEWRISSNRCEEEYDTIASVFATYMGSPHMQASHRDIDEEEVRAQVRQGLNVVRFAMQRASRPKAELVRDITARLIERDYMYLRLRPRMRPPSRAETRYLADTDAFISHLCYYGLEGHPTGSAVFDKMFADVRAFLGTLSSDDILTTPATVEQGTSRRALIAAIDYAKLREVIYRYVIHHPASSVRPPVIDGNERPA